MRESEKQWMKEKGIACVQHSILIIKSENPEWTFVGKVIDIFGDTQILKPALKLREGKSDLDLSMRLDRCVRQ